MVPHRDEVSEGTATALRRSLSRVTRLLSTSAPREHLSQMKLSALASLVRQGSANASTLSERMTIRPQSLTRVLADLEEAHLITRTRAAEDGRKHILSITPKGVELVRQEGLRRDQLLREGMQRTLSRTDIELLGVAAKLLDKMADEWTRGANAAAKPASLDAAEFNDVRKQLRVRNSDLTESRFSNVKLVECGFNNVNLSQSSFTDANLAEASFSDVNLSNASISDSNLKGMKINGVLVDSLFHAYEGRRL